jgi:pimeloyl-ACP methyl ester carboxylesterase
MKEAIAKLAVPLLILTGDEDEPSIDASVQIKRWAPKAALAVLPQSGHGINLEEPALFNQLLDDFLHQVEARP